MINNIKAISVGVISILIMGLFYQLVLIMAAVGYNSLMKWSDIFVPWSSLFTYLIAGIGFFIVMTIAGLLTAMASTKNPCGNAVIAALMGSAISLYLSLQQEIFTLLALLFLCFGMVCSILGCRLWLRFDHNRKK